MKNINKIFFLLIGMNISSNPMCCGPRKKDKPHIQNGTISPKAKLMQLIKNADLAGVRNFTLTENCNCIDEEACIFAKTKFRETGITNPAQWAQCSQFNVMVLVQAMAPEEVKKKVMP